jgi:hypothetical protein
MTNPRRSCGAGTESAFAVEGNGLLQQNRHSAVGLAGQLSRELKLKIESLKRGGGDRR